MAKASTIRMMISSRCNDPVPWNDGQLATLSEVRRELKTKIESLKLFDKKLFEVWINEEAPPKGGTWNSWDVCIEAAKECDLLLVLYNGNAGWAGEEGSVGICHAELMTGLSEAPGKVWLISLDEVPVDDTEEGKRNQRFQLDVARQSLFRGGEVKTADQLEVRVGEAVHDALVTLTQRGVREASKGRFHSGQALDWTRMDFGARKGVMQEVLRDAILRRNDSREVCEHTLVKLGGSELLLLPHAIPAALSVTAAKEMVGQPFLRDHEFAEVLTDKMGGPVHIIACHKTATEAQATRLLGFPDATIVSAPFGIYVADDVQKVQFAFITNCRDEANTRHGVQRFFDWLEQTGEAELTAKRATSRAKIVKAIANEMEDET